MRKGIEFTVSTSDRDRLNAIIADRNAAQKHVWRARIVLLSGDGVGTHSIMATTGKSKTCVWRWQERFMTEGVDGLLRDKTRPPGTPPVQRECVDNVVRRHRMRRRIGRHERWPQRSASRSLLCRRSGKRTVLHRIGGGSSSCRTTGLSPKNCTMWSAFMLLHLPMPWCCRWMKSRKFRHLIEPSRACR